MAPKLHPFDVQIIAGKEELRFETLAWQPSYFI